MIRTNFVVIRLRRTRVGLSDDDHSRTDWIDVFLLPHAHKPQAAALHFRRAYTVCLQYAITKCWQKSIVCPTNPKVTYCSFSSMHNTVSRLTKVQFTGKTLVSKILCTTVHQNNTNIDIVLQQRGKYSRSSIVTIFSPLFLYFWSILLPYVHCGEKIRPIHEWISMYWLNRIQFIWFFFSG